MSVRYAHGTISRIKRVLVFVDGHVEVREEHHGVDEHTDAYDAQGVAEDVGRVQVEDVHVQGVDRAHEEHGSERYSHHLYSLRVHVEQNPG